jgi:hypothetical protein
MEKDFKDEMSHIRSKLQLLDIDRTELASISGQRGSEWHGTDTGFALGRFLDYAGSLCDSPPSSFPGSPIVPHFDTGSDVETSAGTLHSKADSHYSNENNNTAVQSAFEAEADKKARKVFKMLRDLGYIAQGKQAEQSLYVEYDSSTIHQSRQYYGPTEHTTTTSQGYAASESDATAAIPSAQQGAYNGGGQTAYDNPLLNWYSDVKSVKDAENEVDISEFT